MNWEIEGGGEAEMGRGRRGRSGVGTPGKRDAGRESLAEKVGEVAEMQGRGGLTSDGGEVRRMAGGRNSWKDLEEGEREIGATGRMLRGGGGVELEMERRWRG